MTYNYTVGYIIFILLTRDIAIFKIDVNWPTIKFERQKYYSGLSVGFFWYFNFKIIYKNYKNTISIQNFYPTPTSSSGIRPYEHYRESDKKTQVELALWLKQLTIINVNSLEVSNMKFLIVFFILPYFFPCLKFLIIILLIVNIYRS